MSIKIILSDYLIRKFIQSPKDIDKQVVYPELIYRVYTGSMLEKETILKIVMRFYYPQQFEKLIVDHGFKIRNHWGGYAGEPYGGGSELVIEFGHGG